MKAKERLYLTADRDALVGESSPKAAFLYAAVGDDIPDSAVAKFGLIDGRLKPARANRTETLLGSSILPAMVVITPDKLVQLGAVVLAAHKASGLTVDAWNALPGVEREALLEKAIEAMRAAAKPKAAKPKAAKPKAAKPATTKEQKPAGDKEEKPAGDKAANVGAANT